MPMPKNIGVIDTMLDLPSPKQKGWVNQFASLFHDKESKEGAFHHPAGFLFKDPVKAERGSDPIGDTLREMDKHNIEYALCHVNDEVTVEAITKHKDRFGGSVYLDMNGGMDTVRNLVRAYEQWGVKAAPFFPSGQTPPVPINDKRASPVYAKCIELALPIVVNGGVPGPRMPMDAQYVGYVDEVCWFFPELKFVFRHGCEPWTELAVKMLLKWPNLYYSTSAFAPKHFPKDIINYANTRGADKIIYAGYYPSGLSLDRSFSELPDVPFRDHVWPKFLRENAIKVLKLDKK